MNEEIDKNSLFYSRHAIMGYNAILNHILSGRGNGKTFDFKRMALDSDCQTIWLRRYDNDLDDVMREFMADLYKEGYYLDDSITIKDNRLIMNGETKVFFVALSISAKKKSVPYPDVNYIVFDEFIDAKNRYLPKEVEMFLDFIETVNRLRIDRPEVRCFLLANKVSWVNPYFSFFNILPFNGRFKKFKGGLIVVENYNNEEFNKLKKQSKFGRLIEGTRYGRYAIDNESFRDTNAFIQKKPSDSKLKCNIRTGDKFIGVWVSNKKVYLSNDYNKNAITFASRDDLREGEYALKSNDIPISWIKELNTIGQLYYDDSIIKDIAYSLMMESYR